MKNTKVLNWTLKRSFHTKVFKLQSKSTLKKIKLHCFTAIFSLRNGWDCAMVHAHYISKLTVFCMRNMLKKTAFKKNLVAVFYCIFNGWNVYDHAFMTARSKNYILRPALETITNIFYFIFQFMGEIWRTTEQVCNPLHYPAFTIVSAARRPCECHPHCTNLLWRRGVGHHQQRWRIPAFVQAKCVYRGLHDFAGSPYALRCSWFFRWPSPLLRYGLGHL